MNRRAFISGVTVGLLAAPLAAEAQPAGRIPRIAFLSTTSPENSPTTDAFRQGLRELGYVDGRNISIEYRWGRGRTDQFSDFAADVVRAKVEIIVAANTLAGQAAHQATRTIPIVIAVIDDPVGRGFVATLAKPGGNVTGMTTQAPDIAAKRLQLMKEALPGAARIGLLVDTSNEGHRRYVKEVQEASRRLGMSLHLREVGSATDLEGTFMSMTRDAVAAVFVAGGTMLHANRAVLAEHARKHRLPMMCADSPSVEAGCLMAYSGSLLDMFRRAATYVDKILKGAKPADLPIEQPTKFELVINLRTAKALGLTIPQSLLQRADQVLE